MTASALAATGAAAMILHLAGVEKRRGEAPDSFSLRVPKFTADRGQFLAVVGVSGCGKSTLFDMLALISRPDRLDSFLLAGAAETADIGRLWAAGDEARLAAQRSRRIGYVLQTDGLLPFLSVRGNALLPTRLAGQGGGGARLYSLAARLGILELLDKKPHQLSGGQRQRAAILRAMMHKPAVILADEPTAAVDRDRARSIVHGLRRLTGEEGVTVVMVTRDLDLVAGVADRHYGFTVERLPSGGTLSTCAEVPAP
jgi:putative ABC transport system ATP-binding protein